MARRPTLPVIWFFCPCPFTTRRRRHRVVRTRPGRVVSVLQGRSVQAQRPASLQLVQPPEHVGQRRPQAHDFVALFQDFLLQVAHTFAQRFVFRFDHIICENTRNPSVKHCDYKKRSSSYRQIDNGNGRHYTRHAVLRR